MSTNNKLLHNKSKQTTNIHVNSNNNDKLNNKNRKKEEKEEEKENGEKENNSKKILNLEKIPKPFLKWVGGKTQIIDKIINKFPKKINNYIEPFLGGGSVLLALLYKINKKEIILTGKIKVYDLNEGLIALYNNIKNNKENLYKIITEQINIYDSLKGDKINRNPTNLEMAKTSKESYYYYLRQKFNKIKDKSSCQYSALFLILNKLCFRGVYREGPNGFNVPFGHYKKTPSIITQSDLNIYSQLFKNVEFKTLSFTESIKIAEKGDYLYFDPPYAPETSKSFVDYTKDGFGLENHNKLFEMIKTLHIKKIKFMMSNAKVNLVTQNFKHKDFKIVDIEAKRSIHSKDPGTKTTEVIITNY